MSLGEVLFANLQVVAVSMLLLWGISVYRKDTSIIDLFWGFGFAVIAWVSLAMASRGTPRSWLITVLVSCWGIRLSGYLTWRNWGKPEDYRYAAMRERHGNKFPLVSLLTVFVLQGVIMWVVSLPIQVGIAGSLPPLLPAWLGVGCYAIGMFFESMGDYQLARFKANPANRGNVMNRGLWRYTRHPNYFGDFLVWWGIYLVAVESGSWWWTIVGPALMSFLLVRVSGVRLLEGSLQSRLAGYDNYIRNTSSFFPLPPKQ